MNESKINPFEKQAFPIYKKLKAINDNKFVLEESNEALNNYSY